MAVSPQRSRTQRTTVLAASLTAAVVPYARAACYRCSNVPSSSYAHIALGTAYQSPCRSRICDLYMQSGGFNNKKLDLLCIMFSCNPFVERPSQLFTNKPQHYIVMLYLVFYDYLSPFFMFVVRYHRRPLSSVRRTSTLPSSWAFAST